MTTLLFNNLTTITSNPEFSGASATLDITKTTQGFNFKLTNTTGNYLFGDGATSAKLMGLFFDTPVDNFINNYTPISNGLPGGIAYNQSYPPFGQFDVRIGRSSGNPQAALGINQTSEFNLKLNTVYNTESWKTSFINGLQSGKYKSAVRFQSVNVGTGSDKLLYTGYNEVKVTEPSFAVIYAILIGLLTTYFVIRKAGFDVK